MISEAVLAHINAYKIKDQILEAAEFLLRTYHLDHPMLQGFEYRTDDQPNFIVVTTVGDFGGMQTMTIPHNLFNFDICLILNLFAHEILHVKQRTERPYVEDKNEREWQAYCEMLFHTHFPQIPEAPVFNQLQFCKNALTYFDRMEIGGLLQEKYIEEKFKVEQKLESLM